MIFVNFFECHDFDFDLKTLIQVYFFADGHLQICYFQLTACRDAVVVAAVVVVVEVAADGGALPVSDCF